MKLISLLLVLTVAVMGCATGPRQIPIEPLAQASDTTATDTPPTGPSTGMIILSIAVLALLAPVLVLGLAYSGSRGTSGGYGSRTYTSTVKYDTGKVTTYKTTISGNRSTTTVRSR